MKYAIFFTCLLSIGLSNGQNALQFDGVDDYVQCPLAGPTGSSDRTVEAWVKTTSNVSTQQVILDWGDMTTGQRFTLNMINFGKLRIEVGGNGFNSTSSINDGNWHHIAITYNNAAATKFNMYIDGSLHMSSNVTVSVNTTSTNGIIIGRRNDATNYFSGAVDEVRVWNVVRSASEISNNMNSEFCEVTANLVAYFTFNQGGANGSNSGVNKLYNALASNDGVLNSFALTGSASNWTTGKALTPGLNISSKNQFSCDSLVSPSGLYTWKSGGMKLDTVLNGAMCDSLLRINLNLGQTRFENVSDSVCSFYISPSAKYTWTTSGTYYDTIMNPSGCPTYYTIDLDVTTIDTSVTQFGSILTGNETSGVYQWLDCNDNFNIISGATSQSYQPQINGSYAAVIVKDMCRDTTACIDVEYVGISESEPLHFSIYPNPSKGQISVALPSNHSFTNLKLLNLQGEILYQQMITILNQVDLNLGHLNAGVYMLQLSDSEGVSARRLLVME